MTNSQLTRIPFYIEAGKDVLLVWCHLPETPTNHAIIICPPVGHEFINSYRGLRHLADEIAKAGITAFRIEYQGIGDSSGLDTDPDRLQKWQESIELVNNFIQINCGIKQVSLFGLRMGATLASILSNKLNLHSLLCWLPFVEGKRYMREILALQRMGENADLDVDSTTLEGGGFLMTRETMNELLAISLLKINPPNAKHVAVFYSDEMPIPNDLIEHWSTQKFHFESFRLQGYADMMELPHNNKVPFGAIQTIRDYILQNSPPTDEIDKQLFLNLKKYQSTSFDCYTYGSSAKESMDAGGGFPITETICQFSDESLFGIFSEPMLRDRTNKPTILLLNAGSVHRIGPNRNYVFFTRQLLSMGFSVLRMDFLGLGDSINPDLPQENNPYMPEALKNIEAAVKFLKNNLKVHDVILMGLCSGAYASFQAALQLEDDAIREIILINPLTFYWKEGMSLDPPSLEHHWNWNRYAENMRKTKSWTKLFSGKINIKDVIVTILSRLINKNQTLLKVIKNKVMRGLGSQNTEDLSFDLRKIAKKGILIHFFFSDSDPGYRILTEAAGLTVKKLTQENSLEISLITKSNHNFSSHRGRSQLLDKVIKHFSTTYR